MKYNVPLNLEENEAVSELLKNVKPNSVVLEFGCANGRMTKYMQEQLGCDVYIVEYEEEAFNDAKKYAISGICGDIMEFQWLKEFKDIKFNHVIFADVLEHLPNPEKVLKKVNDIIKYDGSVLISVPNVGHNDVVIKLLQGSFEYTDVGLLDNTHLHFFAKNSIKSLCDNTGFALVQKRYIKCNTGESEQFKGNVPEISPICRSIIDERVNGKVYQFLLVLQKQSYVDENNIKLECEDDVLSNIIGKMYFDYGQGYDESNTANVDISQNSEGLFVYNADLKVEDGLCNIRFDPTEGKNCLIKEISAVCGTQNIDITFVNCIKGTSGIILVGPDPQCVIGCNDYENTTIYFHIKFALEGTNAYSDGMQILTEANNYIEQINRDINIVKSQKESLEETYRQLIQKNEQLERENNEQIQRNEQLERENNEQVQRNEQLERENNEQVQRNEQLEKENNEQVQRNEQLEKENNEQVQRNEQLERENSMLKFKSEEYNKEISNLKFLCEDKRREAEENYSKLVERSEAAAYWEEYAKHITCTKSWKVTMPLRIPGHILKNLKTKKNNINITQNFNLKFSILMPVYNVNIKWLRRAIDSVKSQTYTNWELCIVDDASTDENVLKYLKMIHNKHIKIKFSRENGGISNASNEAAKMASGQYILLMDNDDEIASNALMEFYNCIKKTDADVIYSDQDIVDINGIHSCPVCKPKWSPDLFCSQMYLGHLVGFNRKLFEEVGGFRKEFDGSQDYDLLFRITEKTNKIEHIDKILYSWRTLPSSTAANPDSKPYAQYAGLNAVQEHLNRTLGEGMAKAFETDNLFVYDVKYPLKNDILISIIIPTKDHADDLKMAIDSIFEKSSYRNFEIIVLNNNSEKKESYEYFDELVREHDNVKVVEAFYEFNWSKLNNHGMKLANGDVYLFLNNDVKILTNDWLERLASQALRPEIGAVGAMLLYEDGTIQHGGVVVGFGGWADHVYKGVKPVHNGTPFISPVLTRNVTAVTGACMAISKNTVDQIGNFDENFVICGSDVEICIRALNNGLFNVYDPHIRLFHYESKSRGTFVPQIDFDLSYKMYTPYRENGDPYYNNNLDYTSYVPRMKTVEESSPVVMNDGYMSVDIPEITPIHFRKVELTGKRLNILLPSLNPEHVFGGIATAYKFFRELQKATGMDCRVILTDSAPNQNAVDLYSEEYVFMDSEDDGTFEKTIVPMNDRAMRTLAVSDKDYFIFTGWWTAYCIQEEYLNWEGNGLNPNMFIYLIQDYEPGFYQWSSLYLLADSTYRTRFKQVAIFNSDELKNYFDFLGYEFKYSYVFEPVLNTGLKKYIKDIGKNVIKKKQILVYGRPNTARNAFALLVQALRKWVVLMQGDVSEWRVISAGEQHKRVDLGKGMVLEPVGKLTIEEYAKTLEESYAGISLMVSPHPSYPPLEMSVFGVRVITNSYANKDMSEFNKNIVSLKDASPHSIAEHLKEICDNYKSEKTIDLTQNQKYCFEENSFPFMDQIKDNLLN